MSSFGALAHIRYLVSKKIHVKRVKMGHAGTLDPLATGVLILCTGKFTKQIESLQLHTKEYTATLQLGATTPSYDMEHEVDKTYPTAHITRELIEKTLPQFVGDIQQVPPLFSAVMVDGHRAYKIARKGQEVELAAKTVRIDELELTSFDAEKMHKRLGTMMTSMNSYAETVEECAKVEMMDFAHIEGNDRTTIDTRL
jgi:tRNA pseudouridine55 synthase